MNDSIMYNSRIGRIDFIRTIAILLMLIANSCPFLLSAPHPLWLRLISSLAAPLFIFLSGYTFFFSFDVRKNYRHKLIRAFYLLVSAVFIDVLAWRILPFQTFDVIYLISFGMFVNVLIHRLNWWIRLVIAITVIILFLILGHLLSYRFSNPDPMLTEYNWSEFNPASLFQFKRFMIDGWFPVLPWISYSILGCIIAEKKEMFVQHPGKIRLVSSSILVLSVYFLFRQNIFPAEREEYLELFYPPGILYLLISFSFISFIFSFTLNIEGINSRVLHYINLPGRNSLFVYILHILIISYVFDIYLYPLNPILFSFSMLLFIILFFILSLLAETAHRNGITKVLPESLRYILGLK